MIALLAFLVFFLFVVLTVGTIVFILYVNKVNRLAERLDRLERMEMSRSHPETPVSSPVARPEFRKDPSPAQRTPPVMENLPKQEEKPPVGKGAPWLKEGWEWFIGGRLLNRIGALALIIGVGFFLKYAFDQEWITESLRVLMGGMIGTGLVFLGGRFRKKELPVFAQGLVGAGISIDYLAVYASFNFYHLLPQIVALSLMVLVAALAFQQALRHDSLAVSLLGWAGGFLTPFLLSTGEVNEAGLLSYVALLATGLLLVWLKKENWVLLPALTLASVYLIWLTLWEISGAFLLLFGFLLLYWGMFVTTEVRLGRNPHAPGAQIRQVIAGVNAIACFGGMYLLFQQEDLSAGWIALGISLVYFLIAWKGRVTDDFRKQYEIIALTFSGLAVPLWLSPFPTVALWAFGALLLLRRGLRKVSPHLWIFALILYSVALLRLLFLEETWMTPVENFQPLWNLRTLAFLLLAGTMAGGARLFQRTGEKVFRQVTGSLHTGWSLLLFLMLTAETNDWFRQRLILTPDSASVLNNTWLWVLAGIWTLYALPLVWTGMKKRAYPLVFTGLGMLFLALIIGGIRGLIFQPLESYTPLFNLRFMILALLAMAFIVVTLGFRRYGPDTPRIRKALLLFPTLTALILFELFTVETRDLFQQAAGKLASDDREALRSLLNMQQLALSGVWLLYSITLMGVGIWRRAKGIRILAMGLFGVTIAKIFIFDLSFLDTLYRIFSFIGSGLVLLAVSYVYQRYKDRFSLMG